MKKRSLLLKLCVFFIFISTSLTYSQISLIQEKKIPLTVQEECMSSHLHKKMMETDPAYKAFREADEAYLLNASKNYSTNKAVVTIPVVVHVMHTGQAVGAGVNISDEQIQSAITYMTKAFRNQAPYNSIAGGKDTQIEFCLAKRDPSGNPSTGIVRSDASLIPNYSTKGIVMYDPNNPSDPNSNELAIKNTIPWDITKYYNIWIVSEIDDNGGGSGTQGYAYFAGASAPLDGAVMLYNAFGYDLNGALGYNLKPYTNLNITPTHEIGHALNLYHTFEGDGSGSTCPADVCGTSGDCCADTPRHKRSQSDCVVATNSCTGGSSAEHIYNFMDYSSDACQSQFTENQFSVRMAPTLTSGGSRYSLTQSNGCNSVFANDASISAVIAPNGSYCKTTFSPIVTLSNNGSSTLTSVTITYNIDGTGSQTYNWTGSLASNTVVNVTLNSMTTTAGAHTFNAATSLPNGVTDQYLTNDAIAPVAFTIAVSAIPYTQNFEGSFAPTGWTNASADTPDGTLWGANGSKQWERRNTTGNGVSTASAALNCFNYNSGSPGVDELISPAIDLNGTTVPELKFNVAHAYYGASNQERLRVLVSTDCGVTYNSIYDKTYTALATAGQSANSFSPTSAAHWRLETVSLASYIGNSVVLKFEGTSDYGNNLYLDDISVSEPCVAPAISLQPNNNVSSCSGADISISTTATGAATLTYQWKVSTDGGVIFTTITDGGVYSLATTSSLMISGITFGMSTYQYKCIVTNGCGTVTTNTSTLTVNSASEPTISIALTSGTNPTCAGDALTFTATPTNGGTTPSYQWKVNGSSAGTNSAIFSSASITNGQVVTCVLTSNDPCASPLVATSAGTTITTSSSVAPTVSISITSGSNPSPSGSSITFTATPTTGGTTPSYQWQVGGINAGTNASSFVTTALTNGEDVTCILTSNSPCASPLIANSNTITMEVNASTPPPTGSSPQTLCAPATLANFVVNGTLLQWYANSTGGTALSSSTALTNATTYYASQTIGGIESTSRLAVTAAITTVSAPTGSPTQSFCSASTVSNLSPTGPTVQWYETLTGGTALSNSTVLATGTTYYASQTQSACASATRLAVLVTIGGTALPSGSLNQSFCSSGTISNLVVTGSSIQWFLASSAGTALSPSTALTNGTTYYASQTVSGCTSDRLAVNATIVNTAVPTGSANQLVCPSSNVANLVAVGTAIQWYTTASGGTALPTSTPLAAGTTYYAAQTVNGCVSSSRLAVTVTISSAPAAPTTTNASQTFCGGATVANLVAVGSGIQWYGVPSGGAPLASTFALSNATTYFATQFNGSCESVNRLAVSVVLNPTPTATLSALPTVCIFDGPLTLTQGSPVGGVYSGANVSNGMFNPASLSFGQHQITYTFTNAYLCSAIAQGMITVDDCVGVNEIETSPFVVYPNPVSGILTISSKADVIKSVDLYDHSGRLVASEKVNGSVSEVKLNVDMFANGVYSIHVVSETKSVISIICIQN